MNNLALIVPKDQEKNSFHSKFPKINQKKLWRNPFPAFSIVENIPLKLVGYAVLLSKVSGEQKSFSLSLGDKFLSQLWNCSRKTAWRIGKDLEENGLIKIDSGQPQRLPDGNFRQEKKIILIPQWKEKKKDSCVSKITHHNNYIPKECNRTIPSDRKGNTEGYVDLSSLKKYSDKEKRKPNKELKRVQALMLRKCLNKIMMEDKIEYRFMCLMLRKVFGAEVHNIIHYQKMHFKIQHKPEQVESIIQLMIKYFPDIRCPIAWITAELKTIVFNTAAADRDEVQPNKNVLSKQAQAFMKKHSEA